ncbi:MAG: hypothetical protein ACR2NL_01255, partial [Acidimicrobiia bacterium]
MSNLTNTTTALDEVRAAMTWQSVSGPPSLKLTFNGLAEPTTLFDELTALGWTIPARPSRPSSAIEWVPDPVAGTEYTLKPWAVRDFRIAPPSAWDRGPNDDNNVATYAILARHCAEVTATEKRLAELKALAPAPEAATNAATPLAAAPAVSATPTPTAAPEAVGAVSPPVSGAPQIVLVGYSGQQLEGFRVARAATNGRKNTVVGWAESPYDADSLFSEPEDRAALAAGAVSAWTVHYSSAPPAAAAGYTYICAVLPNVQADGPKLAK